MLVTRHHALLRELRALAALAGPIVIVNVGTMIMGAIDVAMVGRRGPSEIGAVGLGNALYIVFSSAGTGVMSGFDPLFAQALGAGERHRVRQLLWQAIWLSLLSGIPLALLVQVCSALLPVFGVNPKTAALTTAFLQVRVFSLVPYFVYLGLKSYLQAHGRTRPLIVSALAAGVVNLPLTYLFVFGDAGLVDLHLPALGVPSLGLVGAAIANTAASFVMGGVLALAIDRDGAPTRRLPDLARLWQALTIGLPIGLQWAAEVSFFSLVAVLVAKIGPLPLAGHQVALTFASVAFMVPIGVGAATSVRVGHAVGRGDAQGVRISFVAGISVGILYAVGCATGFLLAPRFLASLLTDQAAVIQSAMPLLFIVGVFQVFDGTQAISAGALRGVGDTRIPLLVNLIGHYCVGLPIALWLGFQLRWGVAGMWWGLCAGLVVVAVALVMRFARLSSRPLKRI